MPDPREPDISREDDPLTGLVDEVDWRTMAFRSNQGFAGQGFADGYHQGWSDAKAGRAYGSTPAGKVAAVNIGDAGAHDASSDEAGP